MWTSLRSSLDRDLFADVETFCVLIGHVKSGGTLLGALLDAHRNAVFADETDVLRYLDAGFRRDQVFHLLLRGASREAMNGRVTARRLEPYSFLVPGQWQGRHERIRVIGEARAGPTTRRLGAEPDLLPRLRSRMGEKRLAFVHVVRNPYDPIAAMIVRGKRSFENAANDHAAQCHSLLGLREQVPAGDLLTVRYEDFVTGPAERLREVCAFLGLEPAEDYLSACAGIIDPAFRRDRERTQWSPAQVATVRATIDQVPFLHGYRYED